MSVNQLKHWSVQVLHQHIRRWGPIQNTFTVWGLVILLANGDQFSPLTSIICFLEKKGFIGATVRKILITWRILDISVNAYYIIMYIYKCQIFWKLSRITCFLQGFHIAMLEIAQRPNLQMRPKCTFFRCVSISISANFTNRQTN